MKEENSTVLKDKPSIWTWARDSILLVGTIVVIFAALSNSLTWYCTFFSFAIGKRILLTKDCKGIFNFYGEHLVIFGNHFGTKLFFVLEMMSLLTQSFIVSNI